MKTQQLKLENNDRANDLLKSICWLIITFITSMASFSSFAQGPENETSGLIWGKTEVENSTMTAFSAKYAAGEVFLNWNVKNEKEDGVFVIMRSVENSDPEIIGMKEGIGTDITNTLLYSYRDQEPVAGTLQYHLVKANVNGTYYFSETITVNIDKSKNNACTTAYLKN